MIKEPIVKIIISEDIAQQANGNNMVNLIVNPLIVMRAPFVPTALSLGVTIITSGLISNHEYKMEIRITNVSSSEIIYSSGINSFVIPNQSDNFNLNADLKNLPFMNMGAYKVSFILDTQEYEEIFYITANKDLSKNWTTKYTIQKTNQPGIL